MSEEIKSEESVNLFGQLVSEITKQAQNIVMLAHEDMPMTLEVKSVSTRAESRKGPCDVGSYCAVRPCFAEAQGKTFLGVFLGNLMYSITPVYVRDKQELGAVAMTNPAMFVPELNRVVWGYESWWAPIRSTDDLHQISDADIQNVWYVKALNAIAERAAEQAAKS